MTDWKRRAEEAFNDPRQNVNVEVSAYASPDGGLTLNERLAAQRERNTSQYLEGELDRRNIDTDVFAHYTAQDWEGFSQLVAASNLQDKDLILRVLKCTPTRKLVNEKSKISRTFLKNWQKQFSAVASLTHHC